MDEGTLNAVLGERIGFKRKETLAKEYASTHSAESCLDEGTRLFASPEYQTRCFGVFLIGHAAREKPAALRFLEKEVSVDANWRVQEILAMAFARFHDDVGHTAAKEVFRKWLADPNPNLRRAVTEGLRPWHSRAPFTDNPTAAIGILSRFRDDGSEYVRKSAGNALKDIGKKFPDLVTREVSGWDLTDGRIRQTWKHAMRLISRSGADETR